MYTKIPKMTIVSVVVILSMLWAGCAVTVSQPVVSVPEVPVAAPAVAPAEVSAELAGTGPDFPLMPTDEWQTIESGQYQWYAFSYDFDEDYSPVEIRMFAEPKDGAILTVRNAEQAQLWREEGKQEHIGCCTVQDLGNDEETEYALWSGKLYSSGTYYIVVEHAKDLTAPVAYRFEIVGDEGVSMPAELYEAVAINPQPEPPLAMAEEALTVGDTMGSGPDYAMTPTGQWTALESGQYHWYVFDYDFDADYGPVEIRIYTEPKDGAILTVRNADQAQIWREEGKHEHLGCCTVQDLGNDEETDYALWSGKLYSSGTYYIVVEHAKSMSGPAHYMFTLEGEGVSY